MRAERDRPLGGRPQGDPGLGRRGRRPRVPRRRSRGRRGSDRPARRPARRSRGPRRTGRRRGGASCGRASRACCRRPRGSAPGRRRTGPAPVSADRRRARGARDGRGRAAAARAPTGSMPETAASPAIVKLWPSTAASETSARSSGVEAIEPGGDERRERLGDGQGRQVADRPVDAVLQRELTLGQEHPDGLDRVERHPVGAVDDRPDRRLRQARDEAREELAHRGFGQRLEVERGEVALAGAPVGPLLEELRAATASRRRSGRSGSTRGGGRRSR